MFTIEQIERAHEKVKSGSDFPKYIQDIKQLGVIAFETWVYDSHTDYFGANAYQKKSKPKYEALPISENCNIEKFSAYLKIHQEGKTDYNTFCAHCAETGVEKWLVNINEMTCTYFDKQGNKLLEEQIPK